MKSQFVVNIRSAVIFREVTSAILKNIVGPGKRIGDWSVGKEYISGGRLNMKMPSNQYRDPHVKDKMVSRPSYL